MTILKSRKVFFLFFSLIGTIGFYYGLYSESVRVGGGNSYFVITNAIISIFSILALVIRSATPYSLYSMFYVFCLFFYGIAPAIEFNNRVFYWGGGALQDSSYILANVIVLLAMLMYLIISYVLYGSNYCKANAFEVKNTASVKFNHLLPFLLVTSLAALAILNRNNFNVMAMMVRGGEYADIYRSELSGPGWLIYTYFIRPLPVVCFVMYSIKYGTKNTYSALLLCMAIFFSFPTSMARMQVGVLYIPLCLCLFKSYRKEFMFPASIVFSLLFLFPLLDNFRHFSLEDEISLKLNFDFFLAGHFDSYQNFIRVLENNNITYGWQLLGAILFFVPRSIWPEKPVSSGFILAEESNLNLSSIGVNYLGEGYINFGIIGVFLFVAIIAVVSAHIDRIYWKGKSQRPELKYIIYVYPFLLGSIFFILRGSLLSGFAYTVGIAMAVLFVYKINCIFQVK